MTQEPEIPFLGFGSPEALEAAITKEEDDEFVVYAEGVFYASVCSCLPESEVVARMARRPSGTSSGWTLTEEGIKDGTPNPCPCDEKPSTHQHYLFAA